MDNVCFNIKEIHIRNTKLTFYSFKGLIIWIYLEINISNMFTTCIQIPNKNSVVARHECLIHYIAFSKMIRDNIKHVCKKHNRGKDDYTDEDIMILYKYIVKRLIQANGV